MTAFLILVPDAMSPSLYCDPQMHCWSSSQYCIVFLKHAAPPRQPLLESISEAQEGTEEDLDSAEPVDFDFEE